MSPISCNRQANNACGATVGADVGVAYNTRMSEPLHDPRPTSRPDGRFVTTHWSLVLAATGNDSGPARRALAELCEVYWYPLYAFVRRQGYQAAEAQDLTQSFFARLLEHEFLNSADPQRGRFRSYMLTLLKRFLGHEYRRGMAAKRGGGKLPLSLDFEAGERRMQLEPAYGWTAEQEFERRWALALLDQVLESLRRDYEAKGKSVLFHKLTPFITADSLPPAQRDLAAELNLSEGAVKVAIHRLRTRYRDRLRSEITQTVADAADVDDEMQLLLQAVRGRLG
jgi:RNA polymerase sigma factor (sigma-70 family)